MPGVFVWGGRRAWRHPVNMEADTRFIIGIELQDAFAGIRFVFVVKRLEIGFANIGDNSFVSFDFSHT